MSSEAWSDRSPHIDMRWGAILEMMRRQQRNLAAALPLHHYPLEMIEAHSAICRALHGLEGDA